MKRVSLNIHNFLTIQINWKVPFGFMDQMNAPFGYFETERVEHPDIILDIGDFKPETRGCHILDHKTYIRREYIYCNEKTDGIRIKLEIRGIESFPTFVNAIIVKKGLGRVFFPGLLVQNILLRPLVDFKLLQRGVLSLHGCALAGRQGGVVLLGRGGCFKTTVAMNLMRRGGFSLLGDDRVLVHKNVVYCYPLQAGIFNFRLSRCKTEDYRRFDRVRYVLSRLRCRKHPGPIVDRAPLHSVFCLVKHERIGASIRMVGKADVVRRSERSHQLENLVSPQLLGVSTGKLYELFSAYAYVFPNSVVASYWGDHSDLLDHCLNGNEFFEICVPRVYSDSVTEKVVEALGSAQA